MPSCIDLRNATDANTSGLKAARLAHLFYKYPVPRGFVVSSKAFEDHIRSIETFKIFRNIDYKNFDAIQDVSATIKNEILEKKLSKSLIGQIAEMTGQLKTQSVAVRSSSLLEDTPSLSFAGQYDSFLDLSVDNPEALAHYVKLCWASLYTARAISYRHHNHLGQHSLSMAVLVQQMMPGVSGVLFTSNPNDGAEETLIEFHEDGVVQGVNQPKSVVMNTEDEGVEYRQLAKEEQKVLFNYGASLELFFHFPIDMEWVLSAGKLHLLQVRPLILKKSSKKVTHRRISDLPILLGSSVGGGNLVTGLVQKPLTPNSPFKEGSILVVKTTSPEWEPLMRKAKAFITDKGSQTSHAALVAREMGLSAVVGTVDATISLNDGQIVTLDTADNKIGFVYGGAVKEAPMTR